jgi:hypothetical protein
LSSGPESVASSYTMHPSYSSSFASRNVSPPLEEAAPTIPNGLSLQIRSLIEEHVAIWQKAGIPKRARDVRSQGKSGRDGPLLDFRK